MNGETSREDLNFKVECSWRGRVIRRTGVKDSHGMCLQCYARMASASTDIRMNREECLIGLVTVRNFR